METLMMMLHSVWFHGAVVGALGAASADYHAFLKWKSVQDVTQYQWGTALFRWVQGAVVGAVSASGLGALLS